MTVAMSSDLLALQNVSLRLGRSPRFLLQDISFELQAGEVTALLGNPGSGKTSLLQLINGLKSPSQGEIQWQGKPLSEQSPIALRRQIAWLPQQPRLLGMTGKKAIAYPLQLQGLNSSEIQQRLETWIDILKIPLPWLEQREEQLSQPAIQAIALVRSLVMEPQLILLDNPWPKTLNTTMHGAAAALQLNESSELQAWESPQAQVNLALSKFTQAGGAVLWAMTAENNISTAEDPPIPQRLLCLTEGKLTGQHAATPTEWKRALAELAQVPTTKNTASEAEDWD